MASLQCDALRDSQQSGPSQSATPGCDLPSARSLCNATEYGIRSNRHPTDPPTIRAARGRFRRFPGSATGYAKKLPPARPVALFSPDEVIVRSGSPGPAARALLSPPFPPIWLLQTSRLPCCSAPNRRRETSAAYEQYGKGAIGLRWRNRSSSLLLRLSSARLFVACTSVRGEGHVDGRGHRPSLSLHRHCRGRPRFRRKRTALAAVP